jgi:hypothetical protein
MEMRCGMGNASSMISRQEEAWSRGGMRVGTNSGPHSVKQERICGFANCV